MFVTLLTWLELKSMIEEEDGDDGDDELGEEMLEDETDVVNSEPNSFLLPKSTWVS